METKGIPYARAERWERPSLVEPWSGILKAWEFGGENDLRHHGWQTDVGPANVQVTISPTVGRREIVRLAIVLLVNEGTSDHTLMMRFPGTYESQGPCSEAG